MYQNKSKWSKKKNQIERAALLFELYPDIEKAYDLAQDLRNIFEKTTDKLLDFHAWPDNEK
jgi:L-ribulose-5-phosphate 3-epimerase UlaE